MARKGKPKKGANNNDRWLLTYSDLMNLLLILFIILYAASRTDAAQFQQIAESLRVGFSTLSVSQSGANNHKSKSQEDGSSSFLDAEMIQSINNMDSSSSSSADVEYEDFYNQLMEMLKENNLTGSVSVTSREEGIAISFADNVLFAKSSAVLNNSAYSIIEKIGTLIKQLPFSYILVEGHADSDKIHTQYYEDNMDLSAKRAANVWRRFVAVGLPPDKMASVGYGEYRPVAPNDTVENKAKNRRVVITILKKQITSDNTTNNANNANNTNNTNNANNSHIVPDTTSQTGVAVSK